METKPPSSPEFFDQNDKDHSFVTNELSKKLAKIALKQTGEDGKSGPEFPNIPFGD